MNLVNECDNTDVPDYDYSTCENNVYMCCWSEREGGLVKNTVRFASTKSTLIVSVFSNSTHKCVCVCGNVF